MISNILLGSAVMLACLLVQIVLLLRAAQYYVSHEDLVNSPSLMQSMLVLTAVMLMLVLGNLLQAALWALTFMALGEFEVFELAFYHSLVNFATLGYGDIVMSPQWRLLGPIQAINGVLMIGISTATIGQTTQDALRHTWRSRHNGNTLRQSD